MIPKLAEEQREEGGPLYVIKDKDGSFALYAPSSEHEVLEAVQWKARLESRRIADGEGTSIMARTTTSLGEMPSE